MPITASMSRPAFTRAAVRNEDCVVLGFRVLGPESSCNLDNKELGGVGVKNCGKTRAHYGHQEQAGNH